MGPCNDMITSYHPPIIPAIGPVLVDVHGAPCAMEYAAVIHVFRITILEFTNQNLLKQNFG